MEQLASTTRRRRINWRRAPYGAYIGADDDVIFDRDYRPIVRLDRRGNVAVTIGTAILRPAAVMPCSPDERIEFIDQAWFYSDAAPPARDRATRARLQALLDALPAVAAEVARRS